MSPSCTQSFVEKRSNRRFLPFRDRSDAFRVLADVPAELVERAFLFDENGNRDDRKPPF